MSLARAWPVCQKRASRLSGWSLLRLGCPDRDQCLFPGLGPQVHRGREIHGYRRSLHERLAGCL